MSGVGCGFCLWFFLDFSVYLFSIKTFTKYFECCHFDMQPAKHDFFAIFHWICLAVGWSKATSGLCPGFSMSIDAFIMFMESRVFARLRLCLKGMCCQGRQHVFLWLAISMKGWPKNIQTSIKWVFYFVLNMSFLTSVSSVGFCERSMSVSGRLRNCGFLAVRWKRSRKFCWHAQYIVSEKVCCFINLDKIWIKVIILTSLLKSWANMTEI